MDDILDVDLIAFEEGDAGTRAAVVDGVMRSLTNGFVFTSHDISEDLLDTAYGMLAEFFRLPMEIKQRSIAKGSHGQTGYTPLLVETAAGSDAADWKEMLNWGRTVPRAHPLRTRYPHRYMDHVIPDGDVVGMSKVMLEFHDKVFDLQQRFLRIIAVGLGIDESFFDLIVADGGTLTRAIRYPPMTEVPADGQAHVWAGAHGDINLITALPRATSRGLQVQVGDHADGSGHWIDALPPPGHVIINTGIMLERLTNGVIPVGVHRVVADADQNEERYSVVQFCHPTPWTILSPLSSCIDAARPQRFAPIEAGDLLDQVLYDINLVEEARRVSRVVLVHGAFNELWGPNEIAGRWVPALRDGLWHSGFDIDPSDVSVAFYGDLFRHDPSTGDPTDLDEIAARAGLDELVAKVQGPGGLEVIAAAIGRATLDRLLDQAGRYFADDGVRTEVQSRVSSRITDATEVVVAHSMGTIVTYEVLGAMERPAVHFVTIGSPLGGAFMADRVRPSPAGLPPGAKSWVNVAAVGDMACLEPELSHRYGSGVEDRLVDNGHRAHDPEPYLNAAATGAAVAAGLGLDTAAGSDVPGRP